MKKQFRLLAIAAILFMGLNAFAQKPFAGTIIFETTVSGTDDPNITAQLAEMTQEYIVMGNNYRSNVNQGIDVITIANGTNKTLSVILGVPGYGKYYIETTGEDIQKKMETTDMKYDYTGETMQIAGYNCQKVIITATDKETDEEEQIVLYVTSELGLGDAINFATFPELKGYPLRTEQKTEINGDEVTLIQTATSIVPNKKLKPTAFLMPSDAKPIKEAPAELLQMLGMDGEGEEE